MRWSYLRKGELFYVFLAMSSEQGFQKYEADFRRVVGSFRELTNPSFINRTPKRLALVKANGSDTLQGIFKKAGMPDAAWAPFAIMNGLDLKAVPPAGNLVKVVK
jgi:predicted Zn-dependent protease